MAGMEPRKRDVELIESSSVYVTLVVRDTYATGSPPVSLHIYSSGASIYVYQTPIVDLTQNNLPISSRTP